MSGIKDSVNRIVDQALMNKIRAEHGQAPEPMTNHMLLTGNPGTGKTTVTRKMARLFHELGLVSNPEAVQLTRADLVGEFANQSADNTRKVIEDNRGKLIFIDEAYTLYNGPQDHEGRQALDELMRLSEEYRNDTVIVLAGYAGEMERMFRVNPGLASRFPRKVDLPDYTPAEKADVLDYMLNENSRRFSSGTARKRARAYAAQLPSGGQEGNARAVRNFYDLMRDAQATRLVSQYAAVGEVRPEQLHVFTAADITAAAQAAGMPPLMVRTRAKPKAAAGPRRAGYRMRKPADVVA